MVGRSIAIVVAAAGGVCASVADAQTLKPPSAAALALPAPAEPIAELVLFSSRDLRSTWNGSGPATTTYDLCVASTTGRYRLRVMSQAGGGLRNDSQTARLRYTIRFRDGNGFEQSKRVDGQAEVVFEGASQPRSDCSMGANASIEIDAAEGDILAHPAGEYEDRLVLSADPL